MVELFILTVVMVFLTISIEGIIYYYQWKKELMTKWLGRNDFLVHSIIISSLWLFTAILYLLLQLDVDDHPIFHNIQILNYIGIGLFIIGLLVAIWGFLVLGIRRSLGINFYREKVPIIASSIYSYVQDPEYNGFWAILIGWALITASLYNLLIAIEFILLMIPLERLERKPLQEKIP